MYHLLFKPVGEIRSTRRLELVHSDVAMWSDSHRVYIDGCKYFVTSLLQCVLHEAQE